MCAEFDGMLSMQGAAGFLFANFQYTFLGLTMCQSFGMFRQPIYRNLIVFCLFAAQLILSSLLVIVEWDGFADAFAIIYAPMRYRVALLCFVRSQRAVPLVGSFPFSFSEQAVICGIVHMLYERYAVPHESDDEEPVTDMPDLLAALDKFAGPPPASSLSRSWIDWQPTLLPKLRRRMPLYAQAQQFALTIWA